MKILIVGAGIGGLAFASFLEKEGIDYLIVDREKDWSKHGFSLGLWSNGRSILEKLGLADQFDKAVVPYHNLIIKTFKGKTLKKYNLKDFYINYGLAYSHIRRMDLHDWLLQGIDNNKIKLGLSVTDLSAGDNDTHVVFSDGTKGVFDLVVGADGVHSVIRKLYFSEDVEKFIDWRCWYVLPKNKISESHAVVQYLQPGRYCNVFDERDKTLVILSSYVDHTKFDEVEGRISRLRMIFKDNPIVGKALEGLTDAEVMPTDLAEVKMQRWSKDRVVLLGDAAHAFEPFAGLGGSMALEDAYILAGELMQVSESYTMRQALEKYESVRKPRVEAALRVTHKMKLWASLRSPITYRFMNVIAPLVSTRYFYKEFVRLMSKSL